MTLAFSQLVTNAQRENEEDPSGFATANITKELLHYDILKAFSESDISPEVTLQGGSALRLFYGGQRYSEDLDFVIGAGDHKGFVIDEAVGILRSQIMDRYGLNLEVKEPANEFGEASVKKWEFRIDIPGFHKKQMVKVEFCNVPSHDAERKIVVPRYNFLNDSHHSIVMQVESEREILADKLMAVASRRYLKGRDLWDLKFLADKGVRPDLALVMEKVRDYHAKDMSERLKGSLERLKDAKAPQIFMDEMTKFLSSSALKKLYETDPPGIEFIKFAISQMEVLQRKVDRAISCDGPSL